MPGRSPLSACLLLLLAACAGPLYAPAPDHRPGDRFVYRDAEGKGRVYEVVAAGPEGVEWRTDSGVRFTRVDPFAPMVAWDGRTSTGRLVAMEREGGLWPLRRGARETIRAEFVRTSKKTGREERYTEIRECRVNRPRARTVPAGTFTVWKVICTRRRGEDGGVDRTWIWYWSPGLGQWVERVTKDADGSREELELVAFTRGS